MFRRGEAVFLLVILLGTIGLVTFRAWSSPPSGGYVPPGRDEHSYRVAEAYSSRCLQPSITFSVATHRRPGPMTSQEADEHIRRLSHITRTLYSAPVPVDEEELRRVITARTEQLPALIESSNATLSAHAVVEATLRGAKGCVPAIARAAIALGKVRDRQALPYLSRAAKDPVRDVAESASKAIQQIQGHEAASSRIQPRGTSSVFLKEGEAPAELRRKPSRLTDYWRANRHRLDAAQASSPACHSERNEESLFIGGVRCVADAQYDRKRLYDVFGRSKTITGLRYGRLPLSESVCSVGYIAIFWGRRCWKSEYRVSVN